MCYDVKASMEAQLKRAQRRGDNNAVQEIKRNLLPLSDLPLHHVSGFQHPKMLIYTNRSPALPALATWGLIPHWVKDGQQKKQLWNKTLNARGETIFEKPSFRNAANYQRCLVYVDGFYEHHHFKGNTYPFFIHEKDNEPLALAGLWSEWEDPETGVTINSFSIVTTEGNSLMAKIHNNPKLKGPRMPLILPAAIEDAWLETIEDALDKQKIQGLIQSYPEEELQAHTVRRLRGKDYPGNIDSISEPFEYEELVIA
ncbi:SOS response-associated peptidase [Altibacter sp. HG106]|uniref:SOS response-associated peptidase n=1 Tax=Altibacter sp. HG106 TaxID=3023937 RepID=UPI002350D4C2|nr:SOS response-associated peptidase [Altibacter sp. HG106]MDC7995653.1 SOS response-associated peptidase [Altibacter sp. HG106]